MDDTIYRKAAIDAIQKWGLIDGLSEAEAIEILSDSQKVPSAQPEHATCYLDSPCEYQNSDAKLPSAQQCMTATSNTMVSDTVKIPVMDGTTERLPSAQPERKKGRWEVTPVYIKCSECGESFMLIPQNYCPNCGADMRGDT